MSLKFTRKKDRNYILSLFYWIDKVLPLSRRAKLRLYLDLEWAAERLAHEKSFRVFEEHPVRTRSFDFLARHLTARYRVVDLGCGSGDLSLQIAAKTKHVVAIDHSTQLIAEARQKSTLQNLEFKEGNALDFLTSASEPFDVLILSHILEHLDEPETFLKQHLKFARFFYIEVPDWERTPLNAYRQKVNAGLQYSDNDHIWEFDRVDMQGLIHTCGLTIIDHEFRYGVQKYWCEHLAQ